MMYHCSSQLDNMEGGDLISVLQDELCSLIWLQRVTMLRKWSQRRNSCWESRKHLRDILGISSRVSLWWAELLVCIRTACWLLCSGLRAWCMEDKMGILEKSKSHAMQWKTKESLQKKPSAEYPTWFKSSFFSDLIIGAITWHLLWISALKSNVNIN